MQARATISASGAMICRPRSARAPAARAAAAPRRPVAPARRVAVAAVAVDASPEAKYPGWEFIWKQLRDAGLASVGAEQAFDAVELGQAVLIDVRPAEDHAQAHPRGAVSIPAFLVISAPASPGEWAKFLACKANGVVPTKPNPDLAKAVAAAAAGGKAAILACEAGGSLEPTVSFPQGKVSRSLKAAWKLVAGGALPPGQVAHLEGGVFRWHAAGLPMVGEYDASNAGKTPNTAETPTGEYFNKE